MWPKVTFRFSSSNNWTRPPTVWPRLLPKIRRTERHSWPNGPRYSATIPARTGRFCLAGKSQAASAPLWLPGQDNSKSPTGSEENSGARGLPPRRSRPLTPTEQGAMAFADHRARWPQLALWIAANDESRERDWDGLSFQFARRHHHQC